MVPKHLQPGEEAQQRMFFLRKLKQAGLLRSTAAETLLQEHHREHPLPGLYAVVQQLHSRGQEGLSRVVRTAQRIVGAELPDLDSVFAELIQRRARSICRDSSHPGHSLFVPLPSGRRYRTIRARTEEQLLPQSCNLDLQCRW